MQIYISLFETKPVAYFITGACEFNIPYKRHDVKVVYIWRHQLAVNIYVLFKPIVDV